LQHHTYATKAINVCAVTLEFILVYFTITFIGSLTTAQSIFYLYFLALAALNVAFFAVDAATRKKWVQNRSLTVYALVGI